MILNPLTRMQVTEREKKIRQKLTIYVLLRLHLSCPVITIWHLQLPLICSQVVLGAKPVSRRFVIPAGSRASLRGPWLVIGALDGISNTRPNSVRLSAGAGIELRGY